VPLSNCCQDCSVQVAQELRANDPDWFNELVDRGDIDLDEEDEIVYVYEEATPRRYRTNPSALHSHGWRPRTGWEYKGDGPVYLGMELEVEISDLQDENDYAERVQELMGDAVYLQEDSSIGHGFEITTHPMSYAWAMAQFPWDALETLSDEGCSTHNEVGLHIHVSRSAFSGECHLYRWLKFIYRNEQQVSQLARRRYSRWASFDQAHRRAVKHMLKTEDMQRGYDRHGHYLPHAAVARYQAVNPLNEKTLELRVFASSLRPGEVQAALAFAAATVEYTRDLDANKIIQGNGWAWSTFVDWLRQHDEYRPLLVELEALTCVS
jgi:putative amidoligase enzyme